MTPYEIGILLHYYTTPVAHQSEKTDRPTLFEGTMDAFMRAKLIEPTPTMPPPGLEYEPSAYRITEKGKFYVERGLMEVPLPVQEWRIPALESHSRSEK